MERLRNYAEIGNFSFGQLKTTEDIVRWQLFNYLDFLPFAIIVVSLRSTFKVLFIIRAGRLNKAGKATLMIRVTINKKFSEFSSKLIVSPEHWDAKMGRMKGRSVSSLEVNKAIDIMRITNT